MEPDSVTEHGQRLDAFFSARRFALGLALVIVACFAPVLFGFQSFVYRDFGLFGHPLAHYLKESFWRGEIPLWNPLNNCGLPFMAQWNTMVWYPPSLIYVLLPLPWSLGVFCLLHLYAGGLGMFFLARRWTQSNFAAAFAGIVFAGNGLALHCLMWPNNSAALAWMPWILLLVERACTRGGWFLLPAILAGACQFMAGAPEAFFLTWVAAAVLWLAQAVSDRMALVLRAARFLAIVAGIVLLSAVQLLPLMELVKASQRSAGYDTGGWAMPAWGWANLLVPLFRTTPAQGEVAFQLGQAWTSSYYFGIATVWLALYGAIRGHTARIVALVFLLFFGLVLALGDAGLVWPWLKYHVSALGFMRYAVKLVFLIACPLTLLAAAGVADFVRTPVHELRRALQLAAGIAIVLLAAVVVICWLGRQFPMRNEDAVAALFSGVSRAGFLVALVIGLWLLRRLTAQRVIALACAWLGLVLADLLTHVPWQNPTVHASLLKPGLPPLAELRRDVTPSKARVMPSLDALIAFRGRTITNLADRYLAQRAGLSHNLNLLEGIAKCDGFFSLYIAPQQDVQYQMFADDRSLRPSIAGVLGIGAVTAPGKLFEWSTRTNYTPVISAGQQPVFLPPEQQLEAMLKDDFDARTTVLLPAEAQQMIAATRQPTAQVTVERFTPHDIEVKSSAPGPAIVTVSQSFYTPWKAYVDGAPVRLWRANHAFQALEVPAGEHRVRWRYEDRQFRLGAIISGATLLLILGAFLIPDCRRTLFARE